MLLDANDNPIEFSVYEDCDDCLEDVATTPLFGQYLCESCARPRVEAWRKEAAAREEI